MEWADLGWREKAGGVSAPSWAVQLEDGTVGGAERHLTETVLLSAFRALNHKVPFSKHKPTSPL